jgi:nitronate monooxygenase
MVVAQGYEAGGHRGIFDPQAPDGQMSTFTLVQALSGVPIFRLSPPGHHGRRGIRSVMQLGAEGRSWDGVSAVPGIGTDAGYREAIKSA